MADVYYVIGVLIMLSIPLSIWGLAYLMQSSSRRAHRKRWQELAKLSGFAYHRNGNTVGNALRAHPNIHSLRLGLSDQGITGTFEGCWFAIVESLVQQRSLASLAGFSKTLRVTHCVLLDPRLRMGEFHICHRTGRGITAALASIWDTASVELEEAFTQKYYLRSASPEELKRTFDPQLQDWFMNSSPLQISARSVSGTGEKSFPLELYINDKTLLLSCFEAIHSPLDENYGPLRADDLETLLRAAEKIARKLRGKENPDHQPDDANNL